MPKIKLTDGPLKGKTVLVHENVETFTTHVEAGHYEVTKDGATWHGMASKPVTERAPRPARGRTAKATAKPTPPADATEGQSQADD